MSNNPVMLWDVKEIEIDTVEPDEVPAKVGGLITVQISGQGFAAGVTGFLMREGCEQSQNTIIPLINTKVVKGDFDLQASVATYFAQPGSYNLFLWNPPSEDKQLRNVEPGQNHDQKQDQDDVYVAVKRGALTVTGPKPV